jgi:hypothetical protein
MPTNNEAIELPTEITESTTPPTKPTRAEASRQNGAKSRGPITAEGKSTSAQNALRHGEYAKNLTLKYENDEGFIRTLAALESHFKPQTDLEADLILTMAHARWRTIRIWSIEKGVLDQAIDAACAQRQGPQDPEAELLPLVATAHQHLTDTSSVLRMIDRCENRYQRIFSRTLKELLKIRADRRSEEERESKNEQTNPPTHAESMFPVAPEQSSKPQPPPHSASFEAQNRHLAPLGSRIRQSASPALFNSPPPPPESPEKPPPTR